MSVRLNPRLQKIKEHKAAVLKQLSDLREQHKNLLQIGHGVLESTDFGYVCDDMKTIQLNQGTMPIEDIPKYIAWLSSIIEVDPPTAPLDPGTYFTKYEDR